MKVYHLELTEPINLIEDVGTYYKLERIETSEGYNLVLSELSEDRLKMMVNAVKPKYD